MPSIRKKNILKLHYIILYYVMLCYNILFDIILYKHISIWQNSAATSHVNLFKSAFFLVWRLHTSSYIFIRMSCAESISVNGRLDSMGVGSVGKHFLWIPWYPQKAGGPQPFKTVCLCEKVVVVARTADSAAGVSWRHSLWIAFASLN